MQIAIITNERVSAGTGATSGFANRYRLLAQGLAEAGHGVRVVEFGPGLAAGQVLGEHGAAGFDHVLVDSAAGLASSRIVRGARTAVRTTALLTNRHGRAAPWEREVASLVAGWRPDVTLVMAPIRPEAALLVPRGVPSIVFVEEDLTSHWNRSRFRVAAARMLSLGPRSVVVIGDHEVAWAKRWFPRARVQVVPHAIDLAYWSPRALADNPRWDALVVGDFAQERNYAGLDAIVAFLRADDLPDLCIGLVSAGRMPSSVLDRIGGIVHVLGGVPDSRSLYADSRTVLVPAFEVTGVKTQVLQGWASERPVVATAASAASVGGVHGKHLLAGDDPGEVAASLRRLLSDKALAERCVQGGRTRVHEHFAAEVAVAALERAVDAACS